MSDQENRKKPGQMNRRSLLKATTAAPAAALITTLPSRAAGLPAPQNAAASTGLYKPGVFNAHDWRTLQVLSDWIIPADERSAQNSWLRGVVADAHRRSIGEPSTARLSHRARSSVAPGGLWTKLAKSA
ncbi:MAG: twin-arginine translocation signal domain-containing protein [Terriglobia bacterium]